jgi:hypothetical protein
VPQLVNHTTACRSVSMPTGNVFECGQSQAHTITAIPDSPVQRDNNTDRNRTATDGHGKSDNRAQRPGCLDCSPLWTATTLPAPIGATLAVPDVHNAMYLHWHPAEGALSSNDF